MDGLDETMRYHRDATHKQFKDQMHQQEHSAHLQISGITLSGQVRLNRAAVGGPKGRPALAGSRRKHRMPAGGGTVHMPWYQKTVSQASCAETTRTYDRERAGRVSAGNLDMAYFLPRSQPCQGVPCENISKGGVGKDMHLTAGIN